MQDLPAGLYLGRQTLRQGSGLRRIAILKAALRVLVRDGVRGVRHRAVAKEAGVSLSATTYYFKDIHDLLADAFTLYVQEIMDASVNPFWARVNEWMRDFPDDIKNNAAVLSEMTEQMSVMGAHYILSRVSEHREHLLLERAFSYVALMDERIQHLALQHDHHLSINFVWMMNYVGANDAELGAHSIMATVHRLEYEGVMGASNFNFDSVKAALMHQLRVMLAA